MLTNAYFMLTLNTINNNSIYDPINAIIYYIYAYLIHYLEHYYDTIR